MAAHAKGKHTRLCAAIMQAAVLSNLVDAFFKVLPSGIKAVSVVMFQTHLSNISIKMMAPQNVSAALQHFTKETGN